MFFPLYKTFLFADQDRMQDLFRAFRATQTQERIAEVIFGLLILAGIAIAIFTILMVVKSRRRRAGYASPRGLFFTLCRAHKLSWVECWLLWRLARLEQLDEPARLFLEPEWFDDFSLHGALRQRAEQLKNIRDRLFAGLKESNASRNAEQSALSESNEPVGAALPALKTAPELDIPPWPASTLPPLSNTSDGASV
jgi:hypothetical protein